MQASGGARVLRSSNVGAKRVKRVVGDEAAPDQAPKRIDGLAGITSASRLVQRIKKAGAAALECSDQLLFALRERFCDGPFLNQKRKLVGQKQPNASVALAERFNTRPGHFAGSNQRIEPRGIIAGNTRRKNGGLEKRRGNRRSLQIFDGIEKSIEMGRAASPRVDEALPVRKKSGKCVLLNRLDFAAETGKRLAADLAENLGVAPFAMESARTETALENAAFPREPMQLFFDQRGIEREAISGFKQGKRAMRPRIAADQFEHGLSHRFKERRRQAGR